MFYRIFDSIIEETNIVIDFMFKDKVFLSVSFLAIIVTTLGILCRLNETQQILLLIVIAISMILAMQYSYAHKQKKLESKRIIGAELIFFTVIATIIGWKMFYNKTIQNPLYIYYQIKGNLDFVYLICIITPSLLTIIFKIISKNNHPLHGGIVSGHSAFAISLLFINLHANNIYWPLIILPIICILLPRCINAGTWYKFGLRPLSLVSIALLIGTTINKGSSIIIVGANILMLLLIVICRNKKVHKIKEILLGVLLGIVCSAIVLYIFG